MRVDCRNLQELKESVADLSHGDRIVLLTDTSAFRFRVNNNGIDFHESDEKGNLPMSDLIYCPDCGHPKWDKDHFNCTYEPLVGEKAMTPDMKITFPPMIEGQTGWKVVGVDVGPELQLLVIDLGDSCVVKMEKGHWDSGTLVCRGGREDTVKVFYGCFRVLREAIEQKPVPRIERLDSKYLDGLLVIKSGGGEFEHYLSPEVFEGISQLAGKPLPIWEGGAWEELIGHREHPSYKKINIPVWRYTR